MSYGLGIDLGTTFTAAAVDRGGHAEMVTLGDRTAAIPSVVLLRADGTVLIGDAANRRAAVESDRVAREFKRRLGDPTPVLLGGAPHSVASLMAHLLGHVARVVGGQQGGAPDHLILTHPANWGPYKRELFAQVPNLTGIGQVGFVTEPEAAAAHYASQERLEEGTVVAVYDLGGGTFDATVLRKRGQGFEILGTPEGIEGLGGIDFDEAVFGHVDRALDGRLSQIDPDDPGAVAAVVRLRQECVLAKEALSADTETVIPVLLPSQQTEVRLTRGELEEMVRPSIVSTIGSMRRALASASIAPENVDAVLLVGGSSRIPLVSQLVSAELGRPIAVDIHPKYGVALGAAALASGRSEPQQASGPVPLPVPVPVPEPEPQPQPQELSQQRPGTAELPATAATSFGAGAPPPDLAGHRGGTGAKARKASRRGIVIGVAAAAVLTIAGVAFAVSNSGGNTPSGGTTGTESPVVVTSTAERPESHAQEPQQSHPQGGQQSTPRQTKNPPPPTKTTSKTTSSSSKNTSSGGATP
jgi:actin-like ATPase involved in cell morphogenesis